MSKDFLQKWCPVDWQVRSLGLCGSDCSIIIPLGWLINPDKIQFLGLCGWIHSVQVYLFWKAPISLLLWKENVWSWSPCNSRSLINKWEMSNEPHLSNGNSMFKSLARLAQQHLGFFIKKKWKLSLGRNFMSYSMTLENYLKVSVPRNFTSGYILTEMQTRVYQKTCTPKKMC